jgi:hypothetical protein
MNSFKLSTVMKATTYLIAAAIFAPAALLVGASVTAVAGVTTLVGVTAIALNDYSKAETSYDKVSAAKRAERLPLAA